MIAKGTILKSSGGGLQRWRRGAGASDPAATPRLFPALKGDSFSCTDCWYKAEGNETCRPPSAQCRSPAQNKIKAGPFPVVNLLISRQAPDLHLGEVYMWASVQTAPSHPYTPLLSGYARLCEQFTHTRKHTAMQLQARVCNANR